MEPNSAVERYCALDFSTDGELAGRLFGEAEREAAAAHLVLSDHIGSKPADLTGAMASWYDSWVAASRQAALDAVEATSGSVDQLRSGSGVFVERVIDRAEDERIRQKRAVVESARQTGQSSYARLDELNASYEDAKLRFLNLRAEHQRDPKVVNLLVYISCLVVIGIAEMLINFESFYSLKGWTPAISVGVTFVVAVALAFSSHFWGAAIRHFAVLFDPAQDDRARNAQWTMMTLGTLTLSFVLGLVGYARNSYFADLLDELRAIGGEEPNQFFVIGGSMISNMIVWIVGVLIAYVVHDPDPRFPEALKAKDKADRQRTEMTNRLELPLRRKFEQIDAATRNAVEAAKRRHASLANADKHKAARRLFEQVLSQDANVLAVLNQYRQRLTHLVQHEGRTVFERSKLIYETEADFLDAADYAALNLRLKYV